MHVSLQATTLKELDLSGNLLVELPHSLATLPKLEVCLHQTVPQYLRQQQELTAVLVAVEVLL
jgi:hypothetical protein